MNKAMAIAATEAKCAAEKETGLVERLKAAMRVTKDHWLCTRETEQIACAVAAVVSISGEDEKEKLKLEWEVLKAYGRGDFTESLHLSQDLGEDYEPIGLIDLWKSTRSEDQERELNRLRDDREKIDTRIKAIEAS